MIGSAAVAPDIPAVEERLDLLRWVGSPERLTYLAVLQAFDDAKAGYEVQLRPPDVAGAVATARGEPVDEDAATRALDALAGWGVLAQSFDTSRVGSIVEYRRRRPVYQFTELGERAYRGVRDLLRAQGGEGRLQRFALRQIAEQLHDLATSVRRADGERSLVLLNQMDLVLGQLADRSAQFYVLVGAMTQQVDVDADRFVEMKDLLLGHLHEFLEDLHRWSPVIAERVAAVEAVGVEDMLRLVATADDAVFQSLEQRLAEWRVRWEGLVAWFRVADRSSRIAELDRRTVSAIRELTALLRRLLEARGRGASRARDLVDLAGWFWSLDGRTAGFGAHDTAHALFAAMFGLGGARHLGAGHDDPDLVSASTSWANAPAVSVPISLRERGKLAGPGSSAAVPDDRRARAYFTEMALTRLNAEQVSLERLASSPLAGRVLDRTEFDALLRLADLALAAGVPVAGLVATASSGSTHVTIRSADVDTTVTVTDGTLVLCGVTVEVVGT